MDGKTMWVVSSGTMTGRTVYVPHEASPLDAAVAALALSNPRKLGIIMECKRNGLDTDDDVFYVSSETVCRRAGVWGDDEAARAAARPGEA